MRRRTHLFHGRRGVLAPPLCKLLLQLYLLLRSCTDTHSCSAQRGLVNLPLATVHLIGQVRCCSPLSVECAPFLVASSKYALERTAKRWNVLLRSHHMVSVNESTFNQTVCQPSARHQAELLSVPVCQRVDKDLVDKVVQHARYEAHDTLERTSKVKGPWQDRNTRQLALCCLESFTLVGFSLPLDCASTVCPSIGIPA